MKNIKFRIIGSLVLVVVLLAVYFVFGGGTGDQYDPVPSGYTP